MQVQVYHKTMVEEQQTCCSIRFAHGSKGDTKIYNMVGGSHNTQHIGEVRSLENCIRNGTLAERGGLKAFKPCPQYQKWTNDEI